MKERNLNADLIRCVAVFSVVSVHFLLNTGFYGTTVEGSLMLFMCMVRSLFMVCVPLFIILTGYLMWQKKLSRQYYKGILKTLEIYVLASIACQLFNKFGLGKDVTVKSVLLGILDYDAANYAWYIEMYIGLFLLIPFLNLIYHGLKSKKEKQVLIATMLILTLLPKLLNNFNLQQDGWWTSPISSDSYDPIVPGFFTTMYPITYYFIGAYLREFGCRIGRLKNFLLFLLAVAVFGIYNYYRSYGGNFLWLSNSTWGGENLITATLLFALLLQLNPKRWPGFIQEVLIFISQIALGIYLLSWIFDRIVYDMFLKPSIPVASDRWPYYFLAVPAVFIGAAGGAVLIYKIRDILHFVGEKILVVFQKNAK